MESNSFFFCTPYLFLMVETLCHLLMFSELIRVRPPSSCGEVRILMSQMSVRHLSCGSNGETFCINPCRLLWKNDSYSGFTRKLMAIRGSEVK